MPSRGNIVALGAYPLTIDGLQRDYVSVAVDAAHGLAPGDYVALLGTLGGEANGNWLVRDVLTHTQFVVDLLHSSDLPESTSGTWYQLHGPSGGLRYSLERFGDGAGNLVRVTTVDAHGLSAGDSIWIAGTPVPDYNRIHVVQGVITDYDFVLAIPLTHSLDADDLTDALWSPLSADRFEDCTRCLDCSNCECFGHAQTVFRWRGDYDFGDGDIRGLPDFHHKLLDWQESPSALLWRIRYDKDNPDWWEHVRAGDYGGLNTAGGAFAERVVYQGGDLIADPNGTLIQTHHGYLTTTFPAASGGSIPPNPVAAIGPLRDGYIMGTVNGEYSRLSVGSLPFGFTGLQWSGRITAALAGLDQDVPWALDIGCIRCRCSKIQITWPPQVTHEIVADAIKGESPPSYPSTSDWTQTQYDGENRRHEHFRTFYKCQTVTTAERHKQYWAGDVNDPGIAAPCPPDIVVWTHYDPPVNGVDELDWNIETSYTTAAGSEFSTTWWHGWATGTPQGVPHVSLAGIRTVVLDGNLAAGARVGTLASGQFNVLAEWLSSGNAALLIACPYALGAEYSDGGLLAALGSSLGITAPPVSSIFEPNPFSVVPQLTGAGQIGEGVETHDFDLGDGVNLPGEVTGGTVVELGYYSQSNGFAAAPYPVTAMESLPSGSIIVVTSNYQMPETSVSRLDARYAINATRLFTA